MSHAQARYWILTIPADHFNPNAFDPLPSSINFLTGQLECPLVPQTQHTESCNSRWERECNCHNRLCPVHRDITRYLIRDESQPCCCPKVPGFRHWQLVVAFKAKLRLGGVKRVFGERAHCEPTRSKAAIDYVHKDETAVPDTRFTLGAIPMGRSTSNDWEAIREACKRGQLDDIPGDIYVRHYGNVKRIATDHMRPDPIQRTIHVYWGATGVGKSRRAWEEAGMDAFPKDPRTKFWDGYSGQEHVVIDEFRGGIDIAHILRWFDRYPVVVEVKGSSVVLKAKKIWITSNLPPTLWYPDLDDATKEALFRRLDVTEIKAQEDDFNDLLDYLN